MERHFDAELGDLKKDILKMGSIVEETIYKSIEALKALDKETAQEIIDGDKIIDELELKIEEKCLDLLALQQPMAADLRFITMAMKIVNELERIADLSVDIAQRVLQLCGKPLLKPLVDIPKLTQIAQEMVRDAIDSFIHKDMALARRVILTDPEADLLRNAVQDEIVSDFMAKDPKTATRGVPLILIARHLERICDHATNIAEDVMYMVQAKIVKHHPEKLKEDSRQ